MANLKRIKNCVKHTDRDRIFRCKHDGGQRDVLCIASAVQKETLIIILRRCRWL